MTRFARLLLVAVLGATALVAGATTSASAASSPIHPDNRPLTISGATNGALPDTQLLQVSPSCLAYAAAAPSLVSLLAAAHGDGIKLAPAECYRDYAGQVAARADWCARGNCDMAAVPGTSNHGWGKAVDFSDQTGSLTFDSAAYAWLKAHAGWFGWNHPGSMEPTGSVPEPWHWEWVGDGGRMYPGTPFGFGNGFGIPLGGAPVGNLDGVTTTSLQGWSGTATVAGWAIDPDTTASTDVHVYVEGVGTAMKANKPRPDVGTVFAGYDASPHGFSGTVPVLYGKRQVCAYAINAVGKGANTTLGCTVATIGQDPTGSFDSVGVGTGINVQGWALDADATADIDVHVYVNGVFAGAATADQSRADVDALFPRNGTAHGYSFSVPAQAGNNTVCVYGINAGPGTNTLIGCRTVTTGTRVPVGFLDSVRPTSGGVTVSGWAIDPDTIGAIEVHTYIDGVGAGATIANGNRPDLLGPFPFYGPMHGYNATYAASPGLHNVCTYGINVGAGTNVLLGCRGILV